MGVLILGLVVFFGVHSVSIFARPWRDAQVTKLGEPRWKGLYSVFAAVGLVLMIWGYGQARMDPVLVYLPPTSLRYVALLLLVPVFVLLVAAYVPGRITALARHPMLLAIKLWAFAHLLVNGMLHDVLLFGAFLVWAVLDRISMKRRPAQTSPPAPTSTTNDVIAIVAGVGLYAAFVFGLHAWITGVPLIVS